MKIKKDMKDYELYRKLIDKFDKVYRYKFQTLTGKKAERAAPLKEIMYLIREGWITNIEIIEEI